MLFRSIAASLFVITLLIGPSDTAYAFGWKRTSSASKLVKKSDRKVVRSSHVPIVTSIARTAAVLTIATSLSLHFGGCAKRYAARTAERSPRSIATYTPPSHPWHTRITKAIRTAEMGSGPAKITPQRGVSKANFMAGLARVADGLRRPVNAPVPVSHSTLSALAGSLGLSPSVLTRYFDSHPKNRGAAVGLVALYRQYQQAAEATRNGRGTAASEENARQQYIAGLHAFSDLTKSNVAEITPIYP